MDKFILIDGNSLLNRAFYAMNFFTTQDGLPTNAIFGFVKFLFHIISDEEPRYLAVAFDVHAPTFRHRLYDKYKATRKPMPPELMRQVPVLKELLAVMAIKTVELEGYEADDLIGTLTRKFDGVSVLVYTGDRDAYQLVKENVDVCYTKHGVSEIEHLTNENFYEKVGLTPAQIIEEKSLRGDPSDNIPGVYGIGPKTAHDLLHVYGGLNNVYAHLAEITPKLRKSLEEHRDEAYLSRTLATIDTNVPLELTLEECVLRLPFSDEARSNFARLEFRSMIDSDFFPKRSATVLPPVVECSDLSALVKVAQKAKEFAFCVEKEGIYLSVCGQDFLVPLKTNMLDTGYFLAEIRPLVETLFLSDKLAVVSDLKAIKHFLDNFGIEATCRAEDVALLRYLGNSNLRPSDPKELAKDLALPEGNCASALLRICGDSLEKLRGTPEEKLYRELELPLSEVLLDMERTGVRVDLNKFPDFSERYRRELSNLSKKIYSLAGVESFNLNSPFQLSEILFDRLGYDPQGAKKNARGGYSTSADVLEKLAEEHEIARLILRYREVQKLQSTYIDGIRPLAVAGVVHTTYNQSMTTTGRLSSANPNLQNIPIRTEEGRELRKLFIAREGHLLVDADYSQIELRLLAHFSGCASLMEAYRNGADVHAATASRIFGIPLEQVTPPMRRRAKTINFGIIYGMSAFGLSRDMGCTAAEAQDYLVKYFAMHPEVKAYMDENIRKAKADGYVVTALGRKRYIPEIASQNYNLRSFGERAAMNMPLQGSAADIIKLAMLRVHDRLQREGLATKMVLQVHDELVLDAPCEETEYAARLLKEEMEAAFTLKVPLIAEVAVGRSWYEAK